MKKSSIVTVDDLIKVFPNRFEKPSRIVRCFEMFLKYGLVVKYGDGWQITPRGLDALRNAPPEYRGDKGFDRK